MEPLFSLWGAQGYAYGLCATAAALMLLALMGLCGRKRLKPATASACLAAGIPLGVMGARLVYCLVNLEDFLETYQNPWLMLRFYDGGLSMTGLLMGLFLAAVLVARLTRQRPGDVLDALCLPLGLSLAVLRFGERFTDLGVGKVAREGALTALAPWLFLEERIGVATEFRLRVYDYEAVCAVLVCLAAVAFSRWLGRRKGARPGDTALFFAALYGATQILWESMRDDGHLLVVFLRVGQVGAALLPLTALAVMTRPYARLRGGAKAALGWLGMAALVGGVALLEFSLDGRLTWGTPSQARDWGLMAALCLGIFALPLRWLTVLSGSQNREPLDVRLTEKKQGAHP